MKNIKTWAIKFLKRWLPYCPTPRHTL
jgi:hypothetical protein